MLDSRGAVLNPGLSPDHGPCPQPYGHASHGGNDENGFPLHIYLVPYFTILFSVFQAAPWQSAVKSAGELVLLIPIFALQEANSAPRGTGPKGAQLNLASLLEAVGKIVPNAL